MDYFFSPLFLGPEEVFPAFTPALLPEFAVESGFAQFGVYCVMSIAHPQTEVLAAVDFGLVFADVLLEVLGAWATRVEMRHGSEQLTGLRLLGGSGVVRVVCSDRVKESPGVSAELERVRRLIEEPSRFVAVYSRTTRGRHQIRGCCWFSGTGKHGLEVSEGVTGLARLPVFVELHGGGQNDLALEVVNLLRRVFLWV